MEKLDKVKKQLQEENKKAIERANKPVTMHVPISRIGKGVGERLKRKPDTPPVESLRRFWTRSFNLPIQDILRRVNSAKRFNENDW